VWHDGPSRISIQNTLDLYQDKLMQLYDYSRINDNKLKNLTTVKNYRVYTERQLDTIPQIARMSTTQRKAMHVVAKVLPFRVN